MSYAKAMKHARNVRKQRKQGKMHFGFDVASTPWPSIWSKQQECTECRYFRPTVYIEDDGRCRTCHANQSQPKG